MKFQKYLIEEGLPVGTKIGFDKKVFKKLVDIVVSFEPEELSEQQRNSILDIIMMFNMYAEAEDIKEEETHNKISQKCLPKLNQWYQSNKNLFDQPKNKLNKIF